MNAGLTGLLRTPTESCRNADQTPVHLTAAGRSVTVIRGCFHTTPSSVRDRKTWRSVASAPPHLSSEYETRATWAVFTRVSSLSIRQVRGPWSPVIDHHPSTFLVSDVTLPQDQTVSSIPCHQKLQNHRHTVHVVAKSSQRLVHLKRFCGYVETSMALDVHCVPRGPAQHRRECWGLALDAVGADTRGLLGFVSRPARCRSRHVLSVRCWAQLALF